MRRLLWLAGETSLRLRSSSAPFPPCWAWSTAAAASCASSSCWRSHSSSPHCDGTVGPPWLSSPASELGIAPSPAVAPTEVPGQKGALRGSAPLFRGLRVHCYGPEQLLLQVGQEVRHSVVPRHVHHCHCSDISEQPLALLCQVPPGREGCILRSIRHGQDVSWVHQVQRLLFFHKVLRIAEQVAHRGRRRCGLLHVHVPRQLRLGRALHALRAAVAPLVPW